MSKIKLTGNASGTGTLTIAAPNTNSDRTLTLPDGAGEILLSDGDGSNLTGITTGKVLQVVSTTKSDTFSVSMSAGAEAAITGLSASITPTSSSSTILVMVNVSGARSGDYPICSFRVKRGSTLVGVGDAAGSRQRATSSNVILASDVASVITASNSFVDSPATTSATTYSVYFINGSGLTRTMYLNRSATDSDSSTYTRNISTITLMEIAG